MKTAVVLLLLVFTTSQLLSQEVITLSVVLTGDQEEVFSEDSIDLQSGDVAEILSASHNGSFSWSAVALTVKGITVSLADRSSRTNAESDGVDTWTIGGPATIRVRGRRTIFSLTGTVPNLPDEISFLTARVTRAADQTNYLPANTIVLPSSSDEDFEVYLEGSSDLTNWVRVDAGTFGPNSPLRFFRVRGRQASSD